MNLSVPDYQYHWIITQPIHGQVQNGEAERFTQLKPQRQSPNTFRRGHRAVRELRYSPLSP